MKECPTEQQLQEFLAERMTDSACAALDKHLTECAHCQERLQRLTSDAGAARLCRLQAELEEEARAPSKEFLDRLSHLAGEGSSAPPGASTPRERETGVTDWESSEERMLLEIGNAADRKASVPPTLPGYELLEELGRGGMGVVYKARQTRLNRFVAIKMILSGGHAGVGERKRFCVEAEAVARLQHPNIVHIYEIGEHDGLPFLSLEYVEGGNLRQHLDGRPQPIFHCVTLVETLARAVHFAHQQGVLHRDLKPANILLRKDGIVKITDFGLAKNLDGRGKHTRSGAVIGTPGYVAPEQVGAGKQVGPAADVYALGTILYEMMTGRTPFRGDTPLDTLLHTVHQEPPPPSRWEPRLPRDLETICLKCLQKEPLKRYASAHELADELHRFAAGEPIRARRADAAERLWRWCKRKPREAVLGGLLATAILLAASLWLWRTHEKTSQAAVTARALGAAVQEATLRRGQALMASDTDPAPWTLALTAAKGARELLDQGEADDKLRRQVVELVEQIQREQEAAEAKAAVVLRDRGMVQTLADIRLRESGVKDGRFDTAAAYNSYAAAFRGYGIDVENLDQAAAADRMAASAVRKELLAALDDWALTNVERARRVRIIAVASVADPDPWRNRLRLATAGGDRGALEQLAVEAGKRDLPPAVLEQLARGLRQSGSVVQSIRMLRYAQEKYPADLWINNELGLAFIQSDPPQWDQAVRFFTAARALRPESPGLLLNLGAALEERGDPEESQSIYEKALQYKPDYAEGHYNLGNLHSHNAAWVKAIACFERAIHYRPEYPEAHCNLGLVFLEIGEYARAIKSLRRGHALGSQQPGWQAPSAQWVKTAEVFAAIADRLPEVLRSGAQPDNGELILFAEVAQKKRLYAISAGWFEKAFTSRPALARDLDAAYRFKAACSASQAGGAAELDERHRAHWRNQALEWLHADFELSARQLETGAASDRAHVQRRLRRLQRESYLAGMRDANLLAGRPAAEQQACVQFWSAVSALVRRAELSPP